MLRTVYCAGVVALAVALLIAAPVRVGAAEPATETAKILEEIKDLKKAFNERMDQLDRSVKDAQDKAASLDGRLYRLQRDALTVDDLRALRSQVDQLQRDLDGLRGQVSNVRESMKPAPQSPSISRSMAPPMGTLRITSEYAYVAEVLVNGQSYFVTPGELRYIALPEGLFTYQVVGRDPVPRVRAITAAKPVFPVRLFNP